MSNSIGPCPTELDTLDSNIGAALALAAAALLHRTKMKRGFFWANLISEPLFLIGHVDFGGALGKGDRYSR